MNVNRWFGCAALACAGMLAACAQTHSSAGAGEAGARESTVAQKTQSDRQLVGARLYELAFSKRRQSVYVVSAGGENLASEPSRVLRLNPADLSVQDEIPLQRRGFGAALDDEADRLYVGHALDGSVTVVDLKKNQPIGIIQLMQPIRHDGDRAIYPHMLRELVVDKKRQRLYAPGLAAQGSVLYVADTRSLSVSQVIPGFGAGAAGIVLDEEQDVLYVSNLQGQLFALNAATLKIERQWEVKADQLLNLALDRSKNRLVATDLGSERLDTARREKAGLVDYKKRGEGHRAVVIDTRNGAQVASIETGKSPIAPLVDERRDRVYVTNRDSGTVTVLDRRNYSVLRTVSLPPHPNSLALDSDTGTVFVSIKDPSRTAQESVGKILFE